MGIIIEKITIISYHLDYDSIDNNGNWHYSSIIVDDISHPIGIYVPKISTIPNMFSIVELYDINKNKSYYIRLDRNKPEYLEAKNIYEELCGNNLY